MADSKLEGAPIVRQTNCRVGGHTFIWTRLGGPTLGPEPWQLCTCGAYSYAEWAREQQSQQVS